MKPLVAYILLAYTATSTNAHSNSGTISSLSEFDFDENGHVSSHMLIYPLGCAEAVESSKIDTDRFKLHPVTGESELAFFPNGWRKHGAESGEEAPKNVEECRAMCVERGVHSSLVTSAMPERHYGNSSGNFENWFLNSCRRVEVCFMNYHSHTPIKKYWVDHSGKEKDHGTLGYGERKTQCIKSFLGHRFKFRDADTDEVVLEITIEHTLVIAVGDSPDYTGTDRDFVSEIKNTLSREWHRHERVKRTCSPLGFKKGRLPDDVFASISAFYYNNRNYKVREEWSGKGVFVNWWEVDVHFIQVPWDMKHKWQKRLLELVEAWAGVKLEQTDMYGLRRYEEGARLLTHVDRETTHAFSLIVNIAQENLSEPWPVEVYDHANRLHEVTMEPGDVVYYESAKCLHGRNKPLQGKGAHYVNLFTHYRPVGDPSWYTKENPERTPEPLLEVGECRNEQSIQDVGVGAVKCGDDRIGPYLSPTMHVATSGQDLIDWWKSVAPKDEKDEF